MLLAPSGRCAISQVLQMLPQQDVVMPAYTCPVVKTAVEVAGKRIVYVDVADSSVNSTSKEFAGAARPGRILLVTYLFGIPTDIERICELAKDRNCIIIEDVAAAFGATRNGRLLGTFGDFGIFSFERGKRLPAFRGGAIAVNNDKYCAPIELVATNLANLQRTMPIRELLFAFAYNILTIPWLYGRVTLPRLLKKYMYPVYSDAGTTGANSPLRAADTPYYTRAFHPYQANLVLRMLLRMGKIRERIDALVALYLNIFRNQPIATFVTPGCDRAGLLRFPIAVPGEARAEVLRRALSQGLYLESEFEELLPDKSEHSRFPNAVWVARNLLLLPLYTRLSEGQAEQIARRVLKCRPPLPDSALSHEAPSLSNAQAANGGHRPQS